MMSNMRYNTHTHTHTRPYILLIISPKMEHCHHSDPFSMPPTYM